MKKRTNFVRTVSSIGRITPNHLPAFLALKLSIITAVWLAVSLVSAAAPDNSALPFQIGDRVQTIKQAPVFLTPPYSGRFAGNVPAGSQGSITEGPVRSGDIWWWNVHFDGSSDGWVAERQIRNANGQFAGSLL